MMDWNTVFWREWRVFRRRFWKIFSSNLINPLLFLIAFGWGLGRNISINGGSYLQFVVPGIIALTSMRTSFTGIAIPLNISRLYHKTYEEYIIAPISSFSVVTGEVLAGCGRGLFASVIVLGLALLFGARLCLGPLFWLVLVLNAFLFSSLGVVAAMVVNSHEDMSSFTSFVIVPMSFLSNTFFSTEDLPAGVKMLIDLLPLTQVSRALRAAAMAGPFPWVSLWIIIGFAVVFFYLAIKVSLRVE